MNQIFIGQSA